MRLPRAFFLLMLPVALSAFTLPSTLAHVIEAASVGNPALVAALESETTGAQPIASETSGTVHVRANLAGHFHVFGVVSGRRIPFLVDTGATQVAIRHEVARELGLIKPGDKPTVTVRTANGAAGAIQVILPRLDVDGIGLVNVPALVMPEGALTGNLLGMSFIRKLKRFEMADGALTLVR